MEVQLRHFHQPLPQVGVKGRQTKRDKCRLQDAQPSLGGGLRDTAVAGQGGVVQQLPRTARAKLHEALKQNEVAHIRDVSHIPLDVGGDV